MAAQNRKGYLRWVVATLVVIVAIASISLLNFGNNLVYFYTPAEAQEKAIELNNQTVKIGAMVKVGSKTWDPQTLALGFVITDMKDHEIKVSYHGAPPDLFMEDRGVVVEGRLTDGGHAMVAQSLLVKHSEEYKKPDDKGSINKTLMEQSLFKGEKTKN